MMTITFEPGYPKILSASVDLNRKIVVEYYYTLDSIDELAPLVVSCKRRGQGIIFGYGNVYYYGTVDGISIQNKGVEADGTIHVSLSMTVIVGDTSPTLVDPCAQPAKPYNFKMGSVSLDETPDEFYPCEGDIIEPNGANSPLPFINTAGVFLEATRTRGLVQISFSYNVPMISFNINTCWQWIGKTNSSMITVAGITFGPRTLKIENLTFEYTRDELKDRFENPVVWQYYRCDVVLTADPQSFNRRYLNVGTSIIRDKALNQLYSWHNTSNGKREFGTYHEYPGGTGAEGLDAVTEPMFLTESGTGISPTDSTGRQIKTHRYGCMLIPANFALLGLPSLPPLMWLP